MKAQEIINRARKIRRDFVEVQSITLDDYTALDMPEVFPNWAVGVDYGTSDRVRYEDKLYRCVQPHSSLAEWAPAYTPALWVEVAKPGEIPEWKQPAGAHDAYKKGDKVRHNEQIWSSDVDDNIWEPGVFGWKSDQA